MIRVAQIIAGALAMGVFVFMILALVLRKAAIDGAASIVSWVVIGFAFVIVVLHLVVPARNARKAVDRIDANVFATLDEEGRFKRLFGIFNTQQIIAIALLEGAAFANLSIYCSVTPFIGNLGVAVGLLAMIAFQFPTSGSIQNWIDTRSRDIIERS